MSLLPLQLFKNLADETRLGIVLLLKARGELCVCDLCTALAQSQPKISRHLAMLRESGLLRDRKQGKWVHYRLSPQMPAWAAQVIEQAWLSQQDDVRLLVAVDRRQRREPLLLGAEEVGNMLDAQIAEHFGEDARHDQPVFQGVTGPGRRLGAV